MKIYIGGDHAGYELKEKLKDYLGSLGYVVEDKGPSFYDKDDDYPDFVKLVAESVASDEESMGILFGGSGQGEAICANRLKKVRAAVFYGMSLAVGVVDIDGRQSTDPYEIIRLARLHNNANVLSLSCRFISELEAKEVVKMFLETKFQGEERHIRRINKLDQ
jgi:ribose 5-phosphate isomerase B